MPLLKPMGELTAEELDYRAQFHKSTADMFREKSEFSEAKKFQTLSDQYAEELGRRTQ